MRPTTLLTSFLFKDRPAVVLILASFVIGILYVQILFGSNYFSPNSSYWDYPVGLMGGRSDQPSIYSSHRYYVHDQWQWPPFFTKKINWPFGISIAHLDAIPLFSITSKLAVTLVGYDINLFAFWCAAMFLLNGIAMTLLLFTLGHRTLFSALIGTGFALFMPALLWRYGHTALTAHFMILLNLALYFYYRNEPKYSKRIYILFVINTVLSLMVTPYLFLMNLIIFCAFFLQCLFDKRVSYTAAMKGGLLFVGIVLAVMYLEQLIGEQGVGKSYGFGFYSMNLLSPFWPQSSGLLSWTGIYWLNRGSIGGTAGQYEGFNYLGIGGIGLLVIALCRRWRQFPELIKQHAALVLAMLLLILLALSNKIYLGPFLVLSWSLPENSIGELFNQFRSSGRFFWPVAYLILAFAISTSLRSNSPRSAIVVGTMLALQFVDTLPLQAKLYRQVREVIPYHLNKETFGRLLSQHQLLLIYPGFYCQQWDSAEQRVNLELIMLASKYHIATNDMRSSRPRIDCTVQPFWLDKLESGTLYVLLNKEAISLLAGHDTEACREFDLGYVCTLDWRENNLAPLTAR